MPGKVWATEEQTAWLSKRLPDFVEAQRENTTDRFFSITYFEWFHRFELGDLTAEEVQAADSDKEKALSKKTKAQRKVSVVSIMHLHSLTVPRVSCFVAQRVR